MSDQITGRDGYIVCKALAYAILAIERLPREWREESDKEDMKQLLEAYAGKQAWFYLKDVRNNLECRSMHWDELST